MCWAVQEQVYQQFLRAFAGLSCVNGIHRQGGRVQRGRYAGPATASAHTETKAPASSHRLEATLEAMKVRSDGKRGGLGPDKVNYDGCGTGPDWKQRNLDQRRSRVITAGHPAEHAHGRCSSCLNSGIVLDHRLAARAKKSVRRLVVMTAPV